MVFKNLFPAKRLLKILECKMTNAKESKIFDRRNLDPMIEIYDIQNHLPLIHFGRDSLIEDFWLIFASPFYTQSF